MGTDFCEEHGSEAFVFYFWSIAIDDVHIDILSKLISNNIEGILRRIPSWVYLEAIVNFQFNCMLWKIWFAIWQWTLASTFIVNKFQNKLNNIKVWNFKGNWSFFISIRALIKEMWYLFFIISKPTYIIDVLCKS